MLTNAITTAIELLSFYLRLIYRKQQCIRTNIQIGLLLPWLVGCGEESRRDFTPSAPPAPTYQHTVQPVPQKSPPDGPPTPEDRPPSYEEAMSGSNEDMRKHSFPVSNPIATQDASTQYDLTDCEELYSIENIKTKQEAKEAAQYWLKATKKLVLKCFGYEKKINGKIEAEQWWKEFSEGGFVKRWIGNWMLENKRKGKAGKAGQLLAALAKADDGLKNMEECIELARKLGSKKKYKVLTKRKEKLYGQLLNIRNAMAEHITPIGVGRAADKQVRATHGGMPPVPLR